MPQVIAAVVTDSQIVLVAATTFAQGPDVFQCGFGLCHRLTTHPTRHHTMQLARDRFVNFVAGELETTQGIT
jgi:hypothetical protein